MRKKLWVVIPKAAGRFSKNLSKAKGISLMANDGDTGASATFAVLQHEKPEFIQATSPVETVPGPGGTAVITGTSNSASLKIVQGTVEGASYTLEVAPEDSFSSAPDWNGNTNIAVPNDPGAHNQFKFRITVTLPANKSLDARAHTFIIQNEAGDVQSELITVNQAASVKTFDTPVITAFTYPKQPARGGVASPTVTYTQKWGWNGSIEDGGVITEGAELSYAGTYTDASTGDATIPTKGTAISNETTATSVTVTVTINGKSNTAKADVRQDGNYVESVALNAITVTYPKNVPAAGDTVTSAVSGGNVITYTFSSTATSTTAPETLYGTQKITDVYTGEASEGFSAPVSSTGSVTVANRQMVEGDARTSSEITLTRTVTWTPTETYNAKGEKTHSVSDSDTITQLENRATYHEVTMALTTPVALELMGDTYDISPDVTSKFTQSVTYSSGASRKGVMQNVTYTVSAALEGYSLEDSTVIVTENRSEAARNGFTVTVLATGEGEKTCSVDVVFTQIAGHKSYSEITASLSYDQIPASGGSVLPHLSYSQTWGWNGNTTNGGTLDSGATVTYSGSGVNASTGEVSAPSKGTTISDVTTVTSVVVNISMNGKTVERQSTVTQAANSVVDGSGYGEITINIDGASVADIPAKGGSVNTASGVTASQTITYSSGATRAGTVNISYSTVSAESLGTTVKDRTQVGEMTVTASGEGSKTASVTLPVYQQANVQTQTGVRIIVDSPSPNPIDAVPAAGGNVDLSGYRQYSYTSEVTSESLVDTFSLTSGASWCVATENSNLNIQSRGTVVGNARSTQVYWQDREFKSNELTVTQLANIETVTYENPVVTVDTSGEIDSAGGSYIINVSATQKVNHDFSSGAHTEETIQLDDSNYSYSISGDPGFTLDDNTVSADVNESAEDRTTTVTVTVDANGKTTQEEITITQGPGIRNYGNLEITEFYYSGDIPAGGGTVLPTLSYRLEFGYGDQTSGGGYITSGATVTYSGTGVDPMDGNCTAGSKGTQTSTRTLYSSPQVTVSFPEYNKTATENTTVYQEENTRTSSSNQYLTLELVSNQKLTSSSGETVSIESLVDEVRYHYTSHFSSGESADYSTLVTDGSTFTCEESADWLSVSDGNIVVSENNTGAERSTSITIKATYSGYTDSKSMTITQSQGVPTYGDIEVTLSYPQVGAGGGTANPTWSYTMTYGYNGSTTGGGVITGNQDNPGQASLTWTQVSGSGLNTANGEVSVSSKGSTVSGVTTVANVRLTVSLNGKTGTDEASVTQAANNVTSKDQESLVANFSSTYTIDGSGGSINLSSLFENATYYYRNHYTSGGTYSGSESLSYNNLGISISGSTSWISVSGNTFNVSENNGGDSRTSSVYTITATYKGLNDSDTLTITQTSGVITWGPVTVSLSYPNEIPAGGGSSNPVYSYSQSYGYNGETTGGGTITTGLSVSFTKDSGPGTVNSSTGVVTASSKGTAVSLQTTAAYVTLTVTGMGGITGEDSASCVQEANQIEDTSWGSVNVWINARPTSLPAGGGTSTLTYGASQSYTDYYTSGESDSGSVSRTPTISGGNDTGFSRSGSTVTASDRGTTSGGTRYTTVTATYGGVQDEVTISQDSNSSSPTGSYVYRNFTVTATPSSVGAGGGSVSLDATIERAPVYSWDSGDTSYGSYSEVNVTSSTDFSSNQSWASVSGSSASIQSRGTVEGASRTVTFTGEYLTYSDSDTVTQSANEIVSTVWQNPDISISPTSMNHSADGESESFTASATQTGTATYSSGETSQVTNSNFTWSCYAGASWINSQISAGGSGSVTTSANPNTTTRSGTVDVSCTGAGNKKSTGVINVSQDAKEIEYYLEVDPTSLTFDASGGIKSFSISSNDSWTVS